MYRKRCTIRAAIARVRCSFQETRRWDMCFGMRNLLYSKNNLHVTINKYVLQGCWRVGPSGHSFLSDYTLQCLSLIVSRGTVCQHNYNETIEAFEKCSRKMLAIVLFWWELNSEPHTSNFLHRLHPQPFKRCFLNLEVQKIFFSLSYTRKARNFKDKSSINISI